MLDTLPILVATLLAGAVAAYLWTWRQECREPRLLCLMYHRFATPAEYAALEGVERVFTVPLDRFREQLRTLAARGFRPVKVAEAADFVAGRAGLPRRSVLLTIDDGSRSVATLAAPVLREHGFSAVLFVTTDPAAPVFDVAPGRQRLSDDELRALDPDVVQIGAHGVTHRPLVGLNDAELRHELTEARAELGRVLGRPVDYLAIPGNWHDRRVRRMARDAGYRGVWVSDAGTNLSGRDPFRIRRVNVEGCASDADFASLLTPAGVTQIRCAAALKRAPGRIVGPRVWLPIRARIRSVLRPEMLSFRSLRFAGLGLSLLAVVSLVVWWILR